MHALPMTSSAYSQDEDGFTAAMRVISHRHDVTWINLHPANNGWKTNLRRIANADFVLVRSDWGWYPDALSSARLVASGVPSGLLIAGSHPPPSKWEALRFDVLFYETPWYEQFLPPRPKAFGGLGIDTSLMHDHGIERDVDWLFVGRLADFKRPLRILDKSGSRVVIGDLSSAPETTVRALRAGGVEVIDHVTQEELATWYNRSANVLVPCELQGGGERSVLEARACRCAVEIADDNPKLESLLATPIIDHEQYAEIITAGVNHALEGSDVSRLEKVRGEAVRLSRFYAGKVRRAPQTVRLRVRNRFSRP